MSPNVIDVKNGTTKTLTIKNDSIVNFTDLDKDLSKFTFKKSGKNLIIENETSKIKLTIKNYFTSEKGLLTESKLSAIEFKGGNSTSLLSNDVKARVTNYKTAFYDKSSNTYYGTMWDDTITISDSDYSRPTFILGAGKDKVTTNTNGGNVYTGKGENEIHYWAVDTSNNRIYLADEGKTNLVLESTSYRKMINSVYATKDGSLHFKINDANYYIDKYLKTGASKDVKITVWEGTSMTNQQQKTYTLQSYLNNQVKNEYGNIDGLNYFGNASSKKKQKITGNFLNNTLVGGKKADKIYCVGGTNTVDGGYGNDKLYAGSGADTFKFNYGTGWGRDTIYNAESSDKIQLSLNENDNALNYVKKGNNLVVEAYATVKGKYKVADTITVKDYFKADKGKSINDKNRLGKVNNTSMNDIAVRVNASKNDTLGKGKYNIYLSKKNSNIFLDKSADATIVFTSSSSFNKKTLTETYKYQNLSYKNKDVVPVKNGNDLTLKCYTVKEKYSYKTHRLKTSVKTSNITLKDYFSTNLANTGRGKSTVNINNAKIDFNGIVQDIKQVLSYSDYVHLTSTDKKEGDLYRIDSIDKSIIDVQYWVTGSKKNERITVNNTQSNCIDARGGNDTVHAEYGASNAFFYSAGYDNYISGSKNDNYYVGAVLNKSINDFKKKSFSKSSKLHIRDTGGSDNMYISSKAKNLRLLFNVDKQGKIVVSQEFNFSKNDNKIWDSLMIFNKSTLNAKNIQKGNFTGVVEIDNYFADGTSTSAAVATSAKGSGAVETFKTNEKTLNMNTWVQQIAGDVAAWLNSSANKRGYATAADVFNSNDTSSIKALVAIYSKDVYKA